MILVTLKNYLRGIGACALTGAVLALGACDTGNVSNQTLLTSAKEYLAKNDAKSAVVQIKNVLQKEPNSAEGRFLLGRALILGGDEVAGSLELEKALELKYPQAQVLPLLARSMVALGKYREATTRFDGVMLDDRVAMADLKTTIAAAYARQNDLTKTNAALRDALQAVPDHAGARVMQARLAAEKGRFEEALTTLDGVIASHPDDSKAWQYKGEVLLYGKKDAVNALKAFDKAIAADSNNWEVRSSVAMLLLQQNDVKGAKAQIEEFHKRIPGRPHTAYLDAQLAFYNKDYRRAQDLAMQLLKVAPDNPQVLHLAGVIDFNRGALVEAQHSLSKALQFDPSLHGARQLSAQLFLRSGQPDNAMAVLRPLLAEGAPDATTLSLAGEAYLQKGQLKQAETSFMRAAQADPASTGSRIALAMTHVRMGSEVGVKELQSVASTDKGIQADMVLVSLSLQKKDYEQALRAIDGIEAKQPDKPVAADLRARVYLQRKDSTQARANFEKALAIDPAYVPAALGLASLDVADNKPDAALKRLNGVLERSPDNLPTLLAIAGLRAKQGASKQEVADLLMKAVKGNPGDPTPRLLLVDHYLENKDPKAALSAAQDAVAASPNRPEYMDSLGRAQLANGDAYQAITSFNNRIKLEPGSPQPYLRLVEAYMALKNTDAAAESARRALAIAPDLLVAQQALATIALRSNRPDEALQIARTVQQRRPEEAAGYLLEGTVYTFKKDYAAAAQVYRKLLAKAPSTEAAVKYHMMSMASGKKADADQFASSWTTAHPKDTAFMTYLGQLSLSRGDYQAAEQRFQQIITLEPDNARAHSYLARTLVALKKAGAVDHAQKAVTARPNTPDFLDSLALALMSEHQGNKAIETQKKAVDLAVNEPLLRLNLARIYVQAGDKAAARSELERLAKLGSTFAAQSEVQQLLKTL
jgi:putative PEP-CTERM system TPR-repeat lipoprotein